MSVREVMLSDPQWVKIQPLIPQAPARPKGGRPRADDRLVFEGIFLDYAVGKQRNVCSSGQPSDMVEEIK